MLHKNVVKLFKHPVASLTLTRTMLEKSIIDANASLREFALAFDIDMEKMQAGHKFTLAATYADGTPTMLTFYRAKTRGDKRFSCKKLGKHAKAGDTIAFTLNSTGVIVINISKKEHLKMEHQANGTA